MTVTEHIMKNWDNTIRENHEDDDTLFGLPYPYTVPCASGTFQEMYYWDTYFTNIGLILSDRAEQAKNNTSNIAHMIERFGFMPNGSRTWFLSRSQPPFFSEMVRDVYAALPDREWLKQMYSAMEKEYKFWTSRRATEIGLCRYGINSEADEDFTGIINLVENRSGLDLSKMDFNDAADCAVAMCESGWDFNPRMGTNSLNLAEIDLNVLVYRIIKNLAFCASELGISDAEKWESTAEEFLLRMRRYMKNKDGMLTDYDFKSGKHQKIMSAADFFPLAYGLASAEEAAAAVRNLHKLETEYGISTCENVPVDGTYQWHYPNGWAPLQYIVIRGLENYGYHGDALRIAEKYIDLVDRNFETTGNIWEKYNVSSGDVNVTNEYEMPPMLGWTAGVYLFCRNFTGKE